MEQPTYRVPLSPVWYEDLGIFLESTGLAIHPSDIIMTNFIIYFPPFNTNLNKMSSCNHSLQETLNDITRQEYQFLETLILMFSGNNQKYKLYTGCLANRLMQWCLSNNIISASQKGFMPHDGVFEHNFIVQNLILEARRKRSDLCLAWIDIQNAFGSIPHEAITSALLNYRAGEEFVRVIENLLSESLRAQRHYSYT